MTLSEEDRARVHRGVMRWRSDRREAKGDFNKTNERAAIAATDDWIEANQAAFNAALPAAYRNNATTAQKTFLFCAVAIARVNVAFLRRVFGEVD